MTFKEQIAPYEKLLPVNTSLSTTEYERRAELVWRALVEHSRQEARERSL